MKKDLYLIEFFKSWGTVRVNVWAENETKAFCEAVHKCPLCWDGTLSVFDEWKVTKLG